MNLQVDSVKRDCLLRYKAKSKQVHIYRAASELWALGVDLEEAKRIVSEAFDGVIVEE